MRIVKHMGRPLSAVFVSASTRLRHASSKPISNSSTHSASASASNADTAASSTHYFSFSFTRFYPIRPVINAHMVDN